MRSVASQGLRAVCELDLANLGSEVVQRVVRQGFMCYQLLRIVSISFTLVIHCTYRHRYLDL
jgi:hypothetical protein